MKSLLVFVAIAAASIAGAASAAGDAVSTGADRDTPLVAPGLQEIYANFNDDRDNLYGLQGWAITGPGYLRRQTIATAFTAARSGRIRKIELALQWSGTGPNAFDVSIRADAGGTPGAVLHRFEAAGTTPYDTCCRIVTLVTRQVSVTAGTQYWVVAKTYEDTFGGWLFNDVGASGPVGFNEGGYWRVEDDSVSMALRILGD